MNADTLPHLFNQQADYFKALAHPVRLQILTILRQGEACVCHLEAILHKRQAYISQQLAVLREVGLLAERKEGLFVYYSLADNNVKAVLDHSLAFLQVQTDVSPLSPTLALIPSGDCPCPNCLGESSRSPVHILAI